MLRTTRTMMMPTPKVPTSAAPTTTMRNKRRITKEMRWWLSLMVIAVLSLCLATSPCNNLELFQAELMEEILLDIAAGTSSYSGAGGESRETTTTTIVVGDVTNSRKENIYHPHQQGQNRATKWNKEQHTNTNQNQNKNIMKQLNRRQLKNRKNNKNMMSFNRRGISPSRKKQDDEASFYGDRDSDVGRLRELLLNLPSHSHPTTSAPLTTHTTVSTTTTAKKRRLELVHIPKTGGTSLEMAAARTGVAWSYCHHQRKFLDKWLPYPVSYKPQCPKNFTWRQHNAPMIQHLPKEQSCNLWHVPPCFYMFGDDHDSKRYSHENIQKQSSQQPKTQGQRAISYYESAALFAVVRSPYERVVSEFGYKYRLNITKWSSLGVNRLRHELNRWINYTLSSYEQVLEQSSSYMEKRSVAPMDNAKYDINGDNDMEEEDDNENKTLDAYKSKEGSLNDSKIKNFNESISRAIQNISKTKGEQTPIASLITTTRTTGSLCQRSKIPDHYFYSDCHLIPQSHYVFPVVTLLTLTKSAVSPTLSTTTTTRSTTTTHGQVATSSSSLPPSRRNLHSNHPTTGMTTTTFNDNRLVDHVILYDNLQEDFNRLMQYYNLNVTLPSKPKAASKTQNILNPSLINDENRRLIQQIYREDFEVFGFDL